MSLEDAIKDVHALTAAAIELGAQQERARIVKILEEEIKFSETLAGIAFPARARRIIIKIEDSK